MASLIHRVRAPACMPGAAVMLVQSLEIHRCLEYPILYPRLLACVRRDRHPGGGLSISCWPDRIGAALSNYQLSRVVVG